MNHPNLSDEINRNIAKSEIDGGVFLKDLPVGKALLVQTRNALYRIEKRGEGSIYISGHSKYCPEPTECNIHGSTWGGSMLKIGFVGRGMRLEFNTRPWNGETITTSEIQEVTEVAA